MKFSRFIYSYAQALDSDMKLHCILIKLSIFAIFNSD